jgi:hypothetical protein
LLMSEALTSSPSSSTRYLHTGSLTRAVARCSGLRLPHGCHLLAEAAVAVVQRIHHLCADGDLKKMNTVMVGSK